MNPAERVLTIYDKLVSQQKDQPMTQTWSEVFGLESNSLTLEDDVTACLVGLRSQIDFTRLRLTAVGVTPDLTSPGFERMKDTASPAKLHQSWNGLRGNIQAPECRHAFTWASWVLREDVEDEISSESMTELLAELQSLEAALVDTEMSPYLRDFIQRQVDAIRSALRNYGVQGVRPLREAMRKVVGDFSVEQAQIHSESDKASEKAKGVLTRAAQAIDKTAKICDNIDKIKKFGEGSWTLVSTVGPLVLPYLATKLSGG